MFANTADRIDSFLSRTTAPTALPVTRDAVKLAIEIGDITDFDDELDEIIPAAVELVETDCRRALMPQTWTLRLDCFRDYEIELRRPPIQTVSFVKYTTGGVLTTFSSANYQVDINTEPGRIRPAYGLCWPVAQIVQNSVQIQFVAGYASADAVPIVAKRAIYLQCRAMHYGCELSQAYFDLIDRLKWEGGI